MRKKNTAFRKTYYFPGTSAFSSSEFAEKLSSSVQEFFLKNGPCPILFVCIGSDRITGDSLGPLVGYKLEQRLLHPLPHDNFQYRVLGTLSHPIHALNLKQTIHSLRQSSVPYLMIAIDASVGLPESVGHITLSNQPLAPGEGVKRTLPRIGHISITGIVSDENGDLPFHLQNVRLYSIMQMADCIYDGIITFLCSCSSQLPVPAEVPDFPDRMPQDLPASACASGPYPDEPHKYL